MAAAHHLRPGGCLCATTLARRCDRPRSRPYCHCVAASFGTCGTSRSGSRAPLFSARSFRLSLCCRSVSLSCGIPAGRSEALYLFSVRKSLLTGDDPSVRACACEPFRAGASHSLHLLFGALHWLCHPLSPFIRGAIGFTLVRITE